MCTHPQLPGLIHNAMFHNATSCAGRNIACLCFKAPASPCAVSTHPTVPRYNPCQPPIAAAAASSAHVSRINLTPCASAVAGDTAAGEAPPPWGATAPTARADELLAPAAGLREALLACAQRQRQGMGRGAAGEEASKSLFHVAHVAAHGSRALEACIRAYQRSSTIGQPQPLHAPGPA